MKNMAGFARGLCLRLLAIAAWVVAEGGCARLDWTLSGAVGDVRTLLILSVVGHSIRKATDGGCSAESNGELHPECVGGRLLISRWI